MNKEQRQEAYEYARKVIDAKPDIELQADVAHGTGFDETVDGVWVAAWVWVPKDVIPGYLAESPVPAARVEVLKPMGYSDFKDAYILAHENAGDDWTMGQLRSSWAAYQRDPGGHFLSKSKP